MSKTRFTAEVDSDTLTKAREILQREQTTLDETLCEMLNYIVAHDASPCFQCSEPNIETLEAIAEAESGNMVSAGTITDLFKQLNEED